MLLAGKRTEETAPAEVETSGQTELGWTGAGLPLERANSSCAGEELGSFPPASQPRHKLPTNVLRAKEADQRLWDSFSNDKSLFCGAVSPFQLRSNYILKDWLQSKIN